MRLTRLSRLAGVAYLVATDVSLAAAQPQAQGSPAPVQVEVEDDVEVVASPAPAAAPPAPEAPAAPSGGTAQPDAKSPPPPAAQAAPATSSAQAASTTPATQAAPATLSAAPVPTPDAAAATTSPASSPAAADHANDAQRLRELEARLSAFESAQAPANASGATRATAPAPDDRPDANSGSDGWLRDPWLGTEWSAFVQTQYTASQLSEDQLQPGGDLLNRDGFVLRRARLQVQRNWRLAALDIELDANTLRGLQLGMRRLHGSVFWPNESSRVPYMRATAGIIDTPFGYELPERARGRVFAERSLASQAFFPTEADVGAVVDGGVGPFRYALAVLNGLEAGSGYRLRDPNSAKDVLLRVGIDVEQPSVFHFIAGVSFLEGTGFHPGRDSTKNTLQWNDINEDGLKTDAEVSGEPGSAAEPSRNFRRWGTALDARVGWHGLPTGWTWLMAEVSLGHNLDRGLFVADPIASSLDSRELGYYLGFTQEITPFALVGFRYDYYDGNSDFLEARRGHTFKQDQAIRTYSPLVGVVLPGAARLVFQYDIVRDHLGRDARGEPANLRNNQWTLRLQVGL